MIRSVFATVFILSSVGSLDMGGSVSQAVLLASFGFGLAYWVKQVPSYKR